MVDGLEPSSDPGADEELVEPTVNLVGGRGLPIEQVGTRAEKKLRVRVKPLGQRGLATLVIEAGFAVVPGGEGGLYFCGLKGLAVGSGASEPLPGGARGERGSAGRVGRPWIKQVAEVAEKIAVQRSFVRANLSLSPQTRAAKAVRNSPDFAGLGSAMPSGSWSSQTMTDAGTCRNSGT